MDAGKAESATATSKRTARALSDIEEYEEGPFPVYLHQIYSGSKANQHVTVNPGKANGFAVMAVNDWVAREGPEPDSKVVARAQGLHIGSDQNVEQWYFSFNMLFEDDRFRGSSLQVQGTFAPKSPFEWSIVGGTGELALARGVVYGDVISIDGITRIYKLFIHVFYRTIERLPVVN